MYKGKYSNFTDEEIINLVKTKYKDKNYNEIRKINRGLIDNLYKRKLTHIAFPDRKKFKYANLTDDELINIVKTEYKGMKITEIVKIDGCLINNLYKRKLIDIAFPDSKKIKYANLTDDELINIVKTEYKGKKITEIAKIDICLINNLYKRKLTNIAFPNKQKHFSKQQSINILEENDILDLEIPVILYLIGLNKLPRSFSKLCKFAQNTIGRKEMMEELRKSYNIQDDDEEENEEQEYNEELENDENEEIIKDTSFCKSDDYKTIRFIGKSIGNDETVFNTDKFEYLLISSVNKLQCQIMNNENNLSRILVSILYFVLGVILIAATKELIKTFNYILVSICAIIGVLQIISFFLNKKYKDNNYSDLLIAVVFIWVSLILYVYYGFMINILPILFSLYLYSSV